MDTAQPAMAAETDRNAQIENAANAFKEATDPGQPRADDGRFAPKAQPEEELDEPELEAEAEGEEESGEDDHEEAEPAHPLPPSWGTDDAELWETLPPEAQAKIAAREGERDRALNQKFQESANARKQAEQVAAEANANRTKYADQLDILLSAIQPVKPDPRAYGAGTGQYNRELYDLALAEYEQQASLVAQLNQQRQDIRDQEAHDAEQAFRAWKQEHEAQYNPKLMAEVPALSDPVKAEPLLRELVGYAINNGIPESVFSEGAQDQITSAQLHLLWKAQQFDKLRANPAQPKPKPASVAVKPGVSSPRSAQKAARQAKTRDRLAREGSIEAGAAMWKDFL